MEDFNEISERETKYKILMYGFAISFVYQVSNYFLGFIGMSFGILSQVLGLASFVFMVYAIFVARQASVKLGYHIENEKSLTLIVAFNLIFNILFAILLLVVVTVIVANNPDHMNAITNDQLATVSLEIGKQLALPTFIATAFGWLYQAFIVYKARKNYLVVSTYKKSI